MRLGVAETSRKTLLDVTRGIDLTPTKRTGEHCQYHTWDKRRTETMFGDTTMANALRPQRLDIAS